MYRFTLTSGTCRISAPSERALPQTVTVKTGKLTSGDRNNVCK